MGSHENKTSFVLSSCLKHRALDFPQTWCGTGQAFPAGGGEAFLRGKKGPALCCETGQLMWTVLEHRFGSSVVSNKLELRQKIPKIGHSKYSKVGSFVSSKMQVWKLPSVIPRYSVGQSKLQEQPRFNERGNRHHSLLEGVTKNLWLHLMHHNSCQERTSNLTSD